MISFVNKRAEWLIVLLPFFISPFAPPRLLSLRLLTLRLLPPICSLLLQAIGYQFVLSSHHVDDMSGLLSYHIKDT